MLSYLGEVGLVEKTLRGGVIYKQGGYIPAMAWEALKPARDLTILKKLSNRILTNRKPKEADNAYAWMEAWAQENGEPQVFKLLQRAVKGNREPIRLRAMAVLTKLKHRPSVALFESAMGEGQTKIRLVGAKGLAAISKSGDEKRLSAFLIRERDLEVKEALIQALAHIGTPATLDALQFVITSPHAKLKRAAAEAMAKTGSAKAVLLLGLLKRDPNPEIRFEVWRALLKLQPQKTFTELKSALPLLPAEQIKVLGEDRGVKVEVLEHLALEGNPTQQRLALEAIIARGKLTSLLNIFEKSRSPQISAAALSALGAIRKEQSVATYRKALEYDIEEVRAAAFELIGLYGPSALLETALEALTDKSAQVRVQAAYAARLLLERRDPKRSQKRRRRKKKR